jgi:plastocyanin
MLMALGLLAASCSTDEADSATGTDGATSTGDGGTTTTIEGDFTIGIENFAFTAPSVSIPVGQTLTWKNLTEGTVHTTTSSDGVWNSGRIEGGETFSFTFDKPGTFTYFCATHREMTGTVVVDG